MHVFDIIPSHGVRLLRVSVDENFRVEQLAQASGDIY